MDAELAEIRDFLSAHPPFAGLPGAVLETLPRKLELRYFRRGSAVLDLGQDNRVMFVLRTGAVEIRDAGGHLVERCEPGACFGMSTLLLGDPSRYDMRALEDALVLVMPEDVFRALCEQHPAFLAFVDQRHSARLERAVATVHAPERGSAFFRTRLSDLLSRAPVTASPETSVLAAARLMRRERVSSLLVTRGDSGSETLVGILTDRDLRNRVLAEGRGPETPIAQVMTPDPATAQADERAFTLLLAMVRRGVHHMPVLDGERLVGLLSSTDLMRLQHANPVYLVGDIEKQGTVAGLAEACARLPDVLEQLTLEDASADDIGRVVTAVGDAVEKRLLALAEARLGPPPVPYCWLVLGSQARLEQGLSSDQDNALILADEVRPEHDGYFLALARFVSDGLAACGYPYCPGGVMATTERWRQPLTAWRETFLRWVTTPEPEALLNSTIFFDLRALHGETSLLAALHEDVLAATRRNQVFLAYLAQAALTNQPPLGFFRNFVLEKEGAHARTFDLKHRGVAPIVDLARVHALAGGLPQVNTRARLRAAAAAGGLSERAAADLADAAEFIAYVRLRHQGRQVRAGHKPDNFVAPEELSAFERRHLRDAFRIVQSAQGALEQRYPLRYLA